ncbi:RNA polymerase sigma factor [Mucilaginibacter gossypii]|uniref:RNA polymerase sigma factor, sigma-70 family n=1 Tax=Mucilaginibacter gossypii TaxID=551996 RepID=A0A1G8N4W2_9SPHI|nr:RNA polymerase sigma factor [Mucilaginibacter gossypii]SDI75116.1 RNA polymerase sigma factor, sigma-70 family [Mucilaginibacter gossypii]
MKKVVSNFSDEELIVTLKKQHVCDLAISFMYRNYFAVLSNYVRQNQGSDQDAEDVFQEVIVTFIEIVRKEKFRGESSVKTFLFTLNKYTWLNELKKRSRSLQREERYENERKKEDRDISSFLIEREAKSLVNDLIKRLGDTCKKILTAYYYEGLSMKEILPLVNYDNEQVLRNKKYKCLKSLEQLLTANPALAQRFKSALTYEQ